MQDTAHTIAPETSGIRGVLTIQNFALSDDPRVQDLDRRLRTAHDILPSYYRQLLTELRSLCPVSELVKTNRVVLVARSEMAKRLICTAAYSGAINYGALGSASTAISDSNSQLATEVARKLYAARTQTNDTVTVDFYYSKADTNGTY